MHSPIALDDLLAHAGWVRGLARSLVADDATADDVTQDVWISALRRPPERRDGVRGWLATVTRNAARERGRSASRRARREAAVARPEAVAPTIDVVAKGEQHTRLVVAVMDLDEPYRETVLLRFFEGLPPREVADRMNVPVETVRTRTRRALERLRGALDEQERGDRDRWRRALLPLAAPDHEPANDGAPAMPSAGTLALRIVVVAALATVPVLFALGPGAPRSPGHDDGGDAASDVATTDGPDVGAGMRRRVDPPIPATPDDEKGDAEADDNSGEGGSALFGNVAPLPADVDASVYSDGVLEIALGTDPPTPRAKEPWSIVVTFRNSGTGPLRFHVPEFPGSIPFPDIVLRDEAGQTFGVSPMVFQSEWQHGLQGEIVRLEAGEERKIASRVGGLSPVDPEDAARGRFGLSQKSLEAAPGRYTVSAAMRKDKPVVPWGEENMRLSYKEVAGLWTGSVRATPITVLVSPPNTPLLALDTPETLRPGDDTTVTVTLRNPSTDEKTVPGPFAIRRAEKGGPARFAWFRFGDAAEACAPAESAAVRLAAGESRTCTIDLAVMRWERFATGLAPTPWRDDRLDWPHVRNHGAVWVTAGTRDEQDPEAMLGSNTRFVSIEPAPDLGSAGVTVELDEIALNASPRRVLVRLRNGGAESLRVPVDVARGLALTVHTGQRAPRTAVPTQAEGPAGITLAPAEQAAWELTLPEGWPGDTSAGETSVVVRWANALAPAGTVGRVQSAATPLASH